MTWDFPICVTINDVDYPIRNKCDYRVVLDVINILNSKELSPREQISMAFFVFYGEDFCCPDYEIASKEMFKIINMEDSERIEEIEKESSKPPIMDWKHDFPSIAPPISRVLGYSVRDPERYTHWYDFVGAYMEIGECSFSTIINIRQKLQNGKKLEKWEEDFYRDNRQKVDLPYVFTEADQKWLDMAD